MDRLPLTPQEESALIQCLRDCVDEIERTAAMWTRADRWSAEDEQGYGAWKRARDLLERLEVTYLTAAEENILGQLRATGPVTAPQLGRYSGFASSSVRRWMWALKRKGFAVLADGKWSATAPVAAMSR